MKSAISSDSTLAVSQLEAKDLGIFVMPLNVIVDGHEYHDDIDITKDDLEKYMRDNLRISTSTPTPYEIEQYFDKIFAQGYDQIVHFTISQKLSSMFDLFTRLCQELYGDKVLVINSASVCHFMANHVLAAKKWRDEGASLLEIGERFNKRVNSEFAIFIPESLTFLKNGGRVSPAVALLGNFIGLRPILTFENGEIGKKGTTRSLKKTLAEQLEDFKSRAYSPEQYSIEILEFATAHGNLEIVKSFFKTNFLDYEVNIRPISINVCAHAGPGTIGWGFNLKVDSTR
jgi:DegV family protein with EDD domain